MPLSACYDKDYFLHIPQWLRDPTASPLVGSDRARSGKDRTDIHSPQLVLLYFVTGNPGCLSFYDNFLRLLAAEPERVDEADYRSPNGRAADDKIPVWLDTENARRDTADCVVVGFSLVGFEVGGMTTEHKGSSTKPGLFTEPPFHNVELEKGKVYSLQEQISISLARLQALVQALREDFAGVIQ